MPHKYTGATSSGNVWRKVPESDARSAELLVYVQGTVARFPTLAY